MAITIHDVAEKAGVSVTTVSRTLNDRGYISKATREKIYAAIQELNYSPNQLARSLSKQNTQNIGLVVPSISHPFFAQITQLLENRLYNNGYHVLLCTTDGNPGQESHIFDMLRQNRVNGIIIGCPSLSGQEYAKANIPIVSLDTLMEGANVTVGANHRLGGRMAAQALIQGGCRRVLQIIGDQTAKTDAVGRHYSFMEEMLSAGCECISLPITHSFSDLDSMRRQVEHIFDQYSDIDGYFATDLYAAEVIYCAVQRGLSVPDDLQVIGYDGTFAAAALCPQMTVIRQPYEDLADKIIDSMVRLLNNQPVDSHIVLDNLTLLPSATTRCAVSSVST